MTSPDKAELADRLQRSSAPWRARPVKRVYIPKSNNKLRPLGIPTIADRVQQNRVRNALEPQWEARFEPRSYGFRPGRGCHDAIEAVFKTVNGKNTKRVWVLDLDLKAAFDHIDHDFLLRQIDGFPAQGMIRKWFKAGLVDKGEFFPTEEGTPQGGGISPLLLNVALHGMEEAAGVRYQFTAKTHGVTKVDSPVLVRYADDALVLCHSKEHAVRIQQNLARWLAPRGLAFNDDKTRIVHLDQGCDFLGFTIRRFHGKLLIKPSAQAIKRLRTKLRDTVRACYGANAATLIKALVPIVRGWAAYVRSQVASEAFSQLDTYLWRLTYRWATRSHPNKPKRWVVGQYFGRFATSRTDRWVFGDRTTGAFIPRFAWTKIQRHVAVRFGASPDDPDLVQYWADRRRKKKPPLNAIRLTLLRQQEGRCALCGDFLLHADCEPQTPSQWAQWLTTVQTAINRNAITEQPLGTPDDLSLIHAFCRPRTAKGPAHNPTPTGPA